MSMRLKVDFGGVSIGENTARLGVKVDREDLQLAKADEVLCHRRLIGRVVLGHQAEAKQQTKFVDSDYVIEAAFDVKGYSVAAGAFGFGLSFSRADIDISDLGKFAKQGGLLEIDNTEDIPKATTAKADGEGASLFIDDADAEWRAVPVDHLGLPPGILKSLEAASIDTLGALADNQGEKIHGIGPAGMEKISDSTEKFWADNPHLSRD